MGKIRFSFVRQFIQANLVDSAHGRQPLGHSIRRVERQAQAPGIYLCCFFFFRTGGGDAEERQGQGQAECQGQDTDKPVGL